MTKDTKHPSVEELSTYIDSDLDAGRSAEVARHLESCSTCRKVVAELQATREAMGELAETEPRRDLWPDIERATARQEKSGAVAYLRRIWMVPVAAVAGAAAALLLVFYLGGPPQEGASQEGGLQGALAAVQKAEGEYRKAIAALEKALGDSHPDWDSETREVIARSLAEIDESIARCKAALRDNPGSPATQEAILLAYQHKVDFLTDVVLEAG